MNRFYVESFKEEFSMFEAEPIYFIRDDSSDTKRSIGRPFNDFREAFILCNWLNQAENEILEDNQLIGND